MSIQKDSLNLELKNVGLENNESEMQAFAGRNDLLWVNDPIMSCLIACKYKQEQI